MRSDALWSREVGGFEVGRVDASAEVQAHRWQVVDGVVVSSTRPGPILDDVWRAFLDEMTRLRPRHFVALCAGSINIDAAQRRRLTEALIWAKTSVVMLADDRVTMRMAQSIAWFGAKLDTRRWRELPLALDGLELPHGTHRRVLAAAEAFYARHGHLDG